MSFFVVPAVSYQTQQKINKHNEEKEKRRKKKLQSEKRQQQQSIQQLQHSQSLNQQTSVISEELEPQLTSQSYSNLHSASPTSSPYPHSTPTPPSNSRKQSDPSDNASVLSSSNSITSSSISKPIEENTPNILIDAYGLSGHSIEQPEPSYIAEKFTAALAGSTPTSSSTNISNSSSPILPRRQLDDQNKSPSWSDLTVLNDRARNNSTFSNSSNASASTNPIPASSSSNLNSNIKYRRNSSLSSAHSSPSMMITPTSNSNTTPALSSAHKGSTSSRFSRKFSTTFAPTSESKSRSQSIQISPTQSTTSSMHSIEIPPYKPLINLSQLNSIDAMKPILFTPAFQIFRYNNFLEIVSDHHSHDAVNFASIRNHSILKFLNRHRNSKDLMKKYETVQHYDIRFYESILAYELIGARKFIRELILDDSELINHPIQNHEELIQVNFSNYVRYLLNLPPLYNRNHLSETEQTHYRYKDLFIKIADALFVLKREEAGDISNNEQDSITTKFALLLQSITKVSYEFILLEKYHINIISKLNNNFIIESRTVNKLFEKFKFNNLNNNQESVKVLVYNTYFSSQYSWYLSLTLPFVRVYESNCYVENSKIIGDAELYKELEPKTIKKNFEASDEELYTHYFQKLGFETFNDFKNFTPKRLIRLLKSIDNSSPKYSKIKRHEIPDPSAAYSHKPMNFEYFTDSLLSIPNESFELIQSRDLALQLTPTNYRNTIREFYRILKVDGILECPILQFGTESVKQFSNQPTILKRRWNFLDLDVSDYLEVIPNFLEVLLSELYLVFGKGNVKFTVVVLSNKNDLNNFLLTRVGLQLFEMFGKVDEYCIKFKDHDDTPQSSVHDNLFYYIHIKCVKKK
ncbi:hypothetical protein DFJ63DRAFT_320425 [Scheffersomyces coipomensis]|uniref:uncharacterized protein n=1 Tax=Scheffersomyces coipomensis TaxID=1788519 RepID=UPI00315DDD44